MTVDRDQVVRLVRRYPDSTCKTLAEQAGVTLEAMLAALRECQTAGLVDASVDRLHRLRWHLP